jgi:NarL family two-component system response regulator LiaR
VISTHPTIGLYAPTSPTGPPPALAERLSRRQCQVAILVADGLTNKQIASELGIAPPTVRLYISAIVKRLNLDRQCETRVGIARAVIFAWSEAA